MSSGRKKLVVFGAAGRTGRLIVDEALRAGHHVTAAVRAPEKFASGEGAVSGDTGGRGGSGDKGGAGGGGGSLRVVRVDVRDSEGVGEVVRGQDAVVSAVGAAGRKAGRLYSDAALATVAAMRGAGVERYVAITSVGVRDDDPYFSWWYRGVVRPLGEDLYRDMRLMEDIVRGTELDWTFVRPTYLRDGEATGSYRVTDGHTPVNGWRINRADVARFIVAECEVARWSRKAPSLAI